MRKVNHDKVPENKKDKKIRYRLELPWYHYCCCLNVFFTCMFLLSIRYHSHSVSHLINGYGRGFGDSLLLSRNTQFTVIVKCILKNCKMGIMTHLHSSSYSQTWREWRFKFPKFQLIPILCFQVLYDYVHWHCSVDYRTKSILVDETSCENCFDFTLKWFLLNYFGEMCLKGHWTTSASSPNFFQKSWDFYIIRSVYLCSDCMLNLTCSFNSVTKIYAFFFQ